MPNTPECVWDLGGMLLEGPVWVARERALWFVDIKGQAIHRLDPATGERRSFDAPGQATFVLPVANDGFVAGIDCAMQRFDPASGAFSASVPLEPHLPGNRANDATVDPAGRLWIGTMDNGETADTGRLYRVGRGGVPVAAGPGAPITNGPAFSPDGRICYFIDTVRRAIWAHAVSDDGILSDQRLFAEIEADAGHPDGPCIDAEGHLWVGLYGGGGVRRYAPDGTLVDTMRLPVSNVTKVAFGGEDLSTMYITTARHLLGEDRLRDEPLAGGLFAVDAGVKGVAGHECIL